MSDILRPLLYFASIVLSGLFLLFFVQREIPNVRFDEGLVVAIALCKTILGVLEMFRRIARTAHHRIRPQRAFAVIGMYAFLFVLSFAMDYLALHEVDPGSIVGVSASTGIFHRIADMLYFSVSTFTTAGFGDILPISLSARMIASAELMLAFFLTVLVIANMASLREHFRQRDGEGADPR